MEITADNINVSSDDPAMIQWRSSGLPADAVGWLSMSRLLADHPWVTVRPPDGDRRIPVGRLWVFFCQLHPKFPRVAARYTPIAVVIDNDLPREPLISLDLYVPDWPQPPRVYIQSEREMALQHVWRIPVVWRNVHLLYFDVCGWSVWRLKCFSSNLVHLHKRYRGKWVTCIRAFDVGNDFPAYQISCYSSFGLSERQILFSDVK